MAVTGSGTQADPWIVHSYNEIKSKITSIADIAHRYVKLDNDINCNDYGTDFVWNTITPSWTAGSFDLDLNGHTIKNIKVATGGYLFTLSHTNSSTIHDGKILNVFANNAGLFTRQGSATYQANLTIKNVSMSLDLTACTLGFRDLSIINSAIYVQAANLSTRVFYLRGDYNCVIKNSDVLLDIKNMSTNTFASSGVDWTITSSRIRGKVEYTDAANKTYVFYGTALSDSVLSLEVPGVGYGYLTNMNSQKSTVVDQDLLDNVSGSAYTQCTTEEITNGDSLRNMGFMVTNVVGD